MVTERPRIRLSTLDGIRALSAVYVLIFHEFAIVVPQASQGLAPPLRALQAFFGYGHLAVCIFIVLSGFSLTIPLARSNSWSFAGGKRSYFTRRALRLLPAYYAALLLSLVVIVGYQYDGSLTGGSIFSHFFLIHNLGQVWATDINGPMWSVATEWQIYFIMPFVLIPLWRRFGALLTVVLAWLLPTAYFLLAPTNENLSWAAPWFVGSFALGMWGAQVVFSPRLFDRCRRLPWVSFTVCAAAAIVLLVATGNAEQPSPIVDGTVSVFALSLIIASAVRNMDTERRSSLVRFLGSKPLIYLAGFSYSLYLLQQPLLKIGEKGLGRLSISFDAVMVLLLTLGTLVIMIAAWFFSECFERPFAGGGALLPRLHRAIRPVPEAPRP
jgi:peptidoglycan/LPS O-acetylase OafA/YrhL